MERTEKTKLHERVATQLRQHIRRDLKPGDQLASMRALMRKLGVSDNTLRAAQALLAQDGLLEVRHGRGVFVAQRDARRRVGILCEQDITHPRTSAFFRALLWHLRRHLRDHDVRSNLYIGEAQPDDGKAEPTCWRFVEDVHAGRLDGVITLSEFGSDAWLPRLAQDRIPVVATCEPFAHRVCVDTSGMVRDGIATLHAQGCRRIALLAWGLESVMPAFRAIMDALTLPVRAGWCRGDLHPELAGSGWEEFREIWTAHPDRPDGLLVCDDVLFDEAQVGIRELGLKVPEQLRVVTATCKGATPMAPLPVTRFEIDPAEMADALTTMLIRLLDGDVAEPKQIVLPYRREEHLGYPAGVARVATLKPTAAEHQ